MLDDHNWREVGGIALGIALAGFGGVAAFLLGHAGSELTPRQFCKSLFVQLFVALFAGTVASLTAKSLHMGVWHSCVFAAMAGYAGKEFLEWAKGRFKEKVTKGVTP